MVLDNEMKNSDSFKIMKKYSLLLALIILSFGCKTDEVTPPANESGIKIVGSKWQHIASSDKICNIIIESTDACDVSIENAPDWIRLGNQTVSGSIFTYEFVLDENHGDNQRIADVIFTQQNDLKLSVKATVLQSGKGTIPEITITSSNFGFDIRQWIRINPDVQNTDETSTFSWTVSEDTISHKKDLLHVLTGAGNYELIFSASNKYGERRIEVPVVVNPKEYDYNVTKVFEYLPAPGQFVNKLPQYDAGDTQETMNAKALNAIRNGMISLGGFGGYVIMGFDHVLVNTNDAFDFIIKGNAQSTWAEPGIVMVSVDANGNGLPDDEWFEIAGAAYNAVTTIKNCVIDYTLVYDENNEWSVNWIDNQDNSGVISRNEYHSQNYYPQWVNSNSYQLKGTQLGSENIYTSGANWVSPPLEYGYVDNLLNNDPNGGIKLEWAVDSNGNSVDLKGIDFIRIHTGINFVGGWVGEVSTEIAGFQEYNLD